MFLPFRYAPPRDLIENPPAFRFIRHAVERLAARRLLRRAEAAVMADLAIAAFVDTARFA